MGHNKVKRLKATNVSRLERLAGRKEKKAKLESAQALMNIQGALCEETSDTGNSGTLNRFFIIM